jgi:Zn-dependent protease
MADLPRLLALGLLIALIIYSITLHELAHAYTATRLGDPTPGRAGRLTWNPLAQLDLFSSVLLPIFSWLMFGFPYGAAYCPIDPSRFRRPLRDRMLVGLSGPAVNFGFFAAALFLLWLPLNGTPVLSPPGSVSASVLFGLALFSLILGAFNLMPVPGLDGYEVFRPLLPVTLRRRFDGFREAGVIANLLSFVVAMLLFNTLVAPWLMLAFFLFAGMLRSEDFEVLTSFLKVWG